MSVKNDGDGEEGTPAPGNIKNSSDAELGGQHAEFPFLTSSKFGP